MAGPGYIPFGLRTGDRILDDISSARSRLRNARIREGTAVGEGLSQGVEDIIGAAAMTQEALQKTKEADAKLNAKMISGKETAKIKIESLKAEIDMMESAMNGMSAEAKMPYMSDLLSKKRQLQLAQTEFDSYSKPQLEKIKQAQKTSVLDRLFAQFTGGDPVVEEEVDVEVKSTMSPLQAAANARLQEKKKKLKAIKDFQNNRKFKTAESKKAYNPFDEMSMEIDSEMSLEE